MKDTSTAAETIEAALRGAAGWGDSDRPQRLIKQHRDEVRREAAATVRATKLRTELSYDDKRLNRALERAAQKIEKGVS